MYENNVLDEVVASSSVFLRKIGRNWRHEFLSEHNSIALQVDSCFSERIKSAFMDGRIVARSGVLSKSGFSTRGALFPHVTSKYMLHVDIKSYYESLNFCYVEKKLKMIFNDNELKFIKNFYFENCGLGLRRGLRASPFIAEILLVAIDNSAKRIVYSLNSKGLEYTRFYDDMLFSGYSKDVLRRVEKDIVSELARFGLCANGRKTRLVLTNASKFLGLRIHQAEIVVPKDIKNKARIRIYYAQWLYEQYLNGKNTLYDVERTERAIGTAIGTIRYILNNSSNVGQKWMKHLEDCLLMLGDIQSYKENLTQEDSPMLTPVSEDDLKELADLAIMQIRDLGRNKR